MSHTHCECKYYSHVKRIESKQPRICVKGSLGSRFLKPSSQTLLVARRPSPARGRGLRTRGVRVTHSAQVTAGFRGLREGTLRMAGRRGARGHRLRHPTGVSGPVVWAGSESPDCGGEPARTRISLRPRAPPRRAPRTKASSNGALDSAPHPT